MRSVPFALALALACLGVVSRAQTPQTTEPGTFENASIDRDRDGLPASGTVYLFDGGWLSAGNVTFRRLLEYVYRGHHLDRPMLEGAPAWMDADRFDVQAHATGGHVLDADGVPRQTLAMLRAFLAARARMRVRVERRDVAAYALVLARSDGTAGPGLRKSDVDCREAVARMIRGQRPQANCGFQQYVGRPVPTVLTMADMASLFSSLLDRPVIDRTGLTGPFSAAIGTVEIRPSGPFDPGYTPSDPKKDLFELMPEELGLRLEPITAPVDVIVIEHADDPTKGDTLPILVERAFVTPANRSYGSWDAISVTVHNPGPRTIVAWGVRAEVEFVDGKTRHGGGSIDGVERFGGASSAGSNPILTTDSRYTLTLGIGGNRGVVDIRRVTAEPTFVIFDDDTALGDERHIRSHFERRAHHRRDWQIVQKVFDDALAATANPQDPQEVFVAVDQALGAMIDTDLVKGLVFQHTQHTVKSALRYYQENLELVLTRTLEDMRARRAGLDAHYQQRK
jgi:uncharacterized protein (TIGR03435 family)